MADPIRIPDEALEAAVTAITPYMPSRPWSTARRVLDAAAPVLRAAWETEQGAARRPVVEDLRHALLLLSDELDPVEGPVILAWSVDRLADRLAGLLEELAAGQP